MDQGAILVADLRLPGKRWEQPLLVVSAAAFNRRGHDLVVVTSWLASKYEPGPLDVTIKRDHPEFRLTGLDAGRFFQCGKLFTFDRRERHRVIGEAPADVLESVIQALRAVLGLSR